MLDLVGLRLVVKLRGSLERAMVAGNKISCGTLVKRMRVCGEYYTVGGAVGRGAKFS